VTNIRKAFAKINLGLFITARRPNGYHTLETLFAPIAWADDITFEDDDRLVMTTNKAAIPTDEKNLCMKAAKLVQEKFNIKQGVRMHLQKNVPHGAGLGGGSSDAACVITELVGRWKIEATPDELTALGAKLGADVPYFLKSSGLCYATGIGDELEDLNLTLPYDIVTVFPNVEVSTVWAYKNFSLKQNRVVPDLKAVAKTICTEHNHDLWKVFENDFEDVVFRHHREVLDMKNAIAGFGSSLALLSGSGGAVFGLFEDTAKAELCHAYLKDTFPCVLTPKRFSAKAEINAS
jgi:4-diphosphocytidyl-2-C-methyl-D-erythritol kinase